MKADGKLQLAVLISGRGSNMAAIERACRHGALEAAVALVLSDRSDAAGLTLAKSLGLATAVVPAASADRALFEAALGSAIDRSGAQLVLLAGFMCILSAAFVQRYSGRLLNIHPSLLPKHKGLHTHQRVLEAGELEHGASVHFVTAQLDGGPVIVQARVAVRPGDSASELAARVIEQEHRIYPLAIGLIAAGRLRLEGSTIMLDGKSLHAPIIADE